jgi:hypothetical protein
VNRPAEPTVYPPGAELVFALAAALAPDSLLAWRLLVLAAEVATGVLLLGLLRRMDLPRSRVVVYAWAPLAVFEGAQAGHVDFVMLPLLLLALRWRQAGRLARAGAALGLAALVKLYPAALLLAWRRRGDRRLAAAFTAVVVLGYLAYLGGAGPRVTGFLPRYFGSAEDFNIGLRLGVEAALAPLLPGNAEARRGLAMALLFAMLLAVLVRIGRRRGEGPVAVLRAGMTAVAAYLVLVPTAMHAWYAVWILPFLAVRPSPAWLYFTGAVSLSYLKYAWEPERLPAWVGLVEFVPFYALLLLEWRAARAATGPA